MLNRIIIMGRLVRDPEMRSTQSGVAVCGFSIACDRNIVNKQSGERETDFFDVTAWRSTAEFVSKYFAKGRMIVVEGRLQQRSYTDKQGNKRTAVDIVADNVYFGDSKKDTDAAGTTPPASGAAASSYPQQNNDFAEMLDDDGDLPF